MKNDCKNIIPCPFNLMLSSLKDVSGHKEFCNFIDERFGSNGDWKAEIKALFEINKDHHTLTSICSQNKSEPEGVFKIGEQNGIIEAAFVRYLFDENPEKDKTINTIDNWLKPLCKNLVDKYQDYAIRIYLFSLKNKPTDNELKDIKSDLIKFFAKKENNISCYCRWGLVHVFPKNNFPSIRMPNLEIIMCFEKYGITVQARNTDLNKKVLSLIKNKRKQHKTKYANFIKVYYFYINFA